MEEQIKLSGTKTEISVKKKQHKEHKEKELIGKINPHSGHKTFEINNETGLRIRAVFSMASYTLLAVVN
jgi:hypothetical protein